MRIALHLDGRAIRGNERQALLLVRGLSEHGHSVFACCRREGPVRDALREAGALTSSARPRGDVDVLSATHFALWLRWVRADAVLLTSWKRAFVGAWAARAAGVGRVLLRVGGGHGRRGEGVGEVARRYAIASACHAIVANSHEVRRRLLDHIPALDEASVIVVPNAVVPRPSPPAPLRSELAVADGILLVAVGGLEPRKGADLLAPLLSQLGPDVHVAVAGGGTAARSAALVAAARALGVGARFHLLGRRDDVPSVLAAADAFVLPSRDDSLPNALLEAMAEGVPVVASAVDGVASAIGTHDGRPSAGWIAPPGDADALAAAVGEVVADLRSGAALVRARVREARWRVEHWYTPETMVAAYERVLKGLPPT